MLNRPMLRNFDDHPPFCYAEYRSTRLRSPNQPLVSIVKTLGEVTGPGPVWSRLSEEDADLTTNARTGQPAMGARTLVTGRVCDEHGVAQPGAVIEIWQANAAGRYLHPKETEYDAPLDPNFLGVGQCRADAQGGFRFTTIRPGPYPWGNHENAWRPAHIHLSIYGPALATRLVTQFYFPDDPLLALDPIFLSTPVHARERLIARYDHEVTEPGWALGYRFDIVLRGGFGP